MNPILIWPCLKYFSHWTWAGNFYAGSGVARAGLKYWLAHVVAFYAWSSAFCLHTDIACHTSQGQDGWMSWNETRGWDGLGGGEGGLGWPGYRMTGWVGMGPEEWWLDDGGAARDGLARQKGQWRRPGSIHPVYGSVNGDFVTLRGSLLYS